MAPAKEGKTTFAQYLALCLSRGVSFLGKYSTKKSIVLYIPLEDHRGEFKAKIKHMLGDGRFPKNFRVLNALAIQFPKDGGGILREIKKRKANVVILDTFRRSHNAQEDSSTEMQPILKELKRWKDEAGVTVVIVHHTGHSGNGKLRGSSDFDGFWETKMEIKKKEKLNELKVKHRYRVDVKLPYRLAIGQEFDTHLQCYPIVGLELCGTDGRIMRDEDEIVLNKLKKGSTSANGLQVVLKGKLSRPKIDEALKRLDVQGRVKQDGKGRCSCWVFVQKCK